MHLQPRKISARAAEEDVNSTAAASIDVPCTNNICRHLPSFESQSANTPKERRSHSCVSVTFKGPR